MRIRIEASENDPYWIIGDPALDEIAQMSQALSDRVQVTRNQQAINGAEWEGVLFRDRKNQRVVFSAMVNRKFESEWDRMDFLSRLAAINAVQQEHVWEGDVWVRLDKPGTSEFREWKLAEAVIGIAGTDLQGAVGLNITYTVSCGGFSGEVRDGSGQHVNLIVSGGTDVFGLSITASNIQATFDAMRSDSTVDFVLRVTAKPTGGAEVQATRYFIDSGTAGGSTYLMPVADSLAALATDLDAVFGALVITGTDGILTMTAATGIYDYVYVEVFERHTNAYGSIVAFSPPGRVDAAMIPGEVFALTVTTEDGTFALTALDETLSS